MKAAATRPSCGMHAAAVKASTAAKTTAADMHASTAPEAAAAMKAASASVEATAAAVEAPTAAAVKAASAAAVKAAAATTMEATAATAATAAAGSRLRWAREPKSGDCARQDCGERERNRFAASSSRHIFSSTSRNGQVGNPEDSLGTR